MMWKTVCLLAVCGVLACSAPGRAWADTALDYQPFGEELAAFLDGQAGVYGVYLIDLNSGASLGYNEKETFHGASTFKVPLNLYLFEQVAAGRVNPDGYLMYREAHYEEGTGYLHKEEFGTYFRIERLARDSIVYSDNVATNMLLGYVGRRNVTAHMRALGGTAVSDQANVTCAADLALYFQGVLEFARRQPVHGERLLGYLRNTVHGDRIPQSLPAKIPVAHKTGDWPAQRSWHDAGIVEHPIRPYILAVLSKNTPGYVYACATIREVSRRVYEYQSDPFFHLTVYIDGQPVELSGALNRDGRFLVPVRAFVDLLAGYTVRWLPEDRAVLILDAEGRISARLTVDSSGLVLHRGRTYLPSRQAGEILGYTVR
ncbi:MAG: serine hydrolase, partial [Candidatus Desulforudis sp.]|nr:serine hydrolase [Desulforudis sp.]